MGAKMARPRWRSLLGEQMDGFFAVTGAELDDAFDRRGGDDVVRVGFENAVFGAGQIILRQLADLFEQFGTVIVVKMISFEPARLVPQRRQDRQASAPRRDRRLRRDQMPSRLATTSVNV